MVGTGEGQWWTAHRQAMDRSTRSLQTTATTRRRWTAGAGVSRKEVIQPQLPLRLPCYDFTPITDPTLDGSLQTSWLGPLLQVLPAFVV